MSVWSYSTTKLEKNLIIQDWKTLINQTLIEINQFFKGTYQCIERATKRNRWTKRDGSIISFKRINNILRGDKSKCIIN